MEKGDDSAASHPPVFLDSDCIHKASTVQTNATSGIQSGPSEGSLLQMCALMIEQPRQQQAIASNSRTVAPTAVYVATIFFCDEH